SRGGTVARGRSAAQRREAPDEPRGLQSVTGGQDGSPMELDRLIHERLRLALVSALAVNESLSFNELKELLGATDGNLSVHARKLEEAGYIAVRKRFDGRMSRTEFELTRQGREALGRYLDHMEALIRTARGE